MTPVSSPAPAGASPPDPAQLLRSRSYVLVLVLGAIIGVPVAAVAYFYLKLVAEAQTWVFTTLPGDLGFSGEPALWPLLPLTVSGLLVGLTLRYLPGTGGHKPAEGFKASGPVLPIELPGIVIASFATLSLGVVLGPEAPLIGIGSPMMGVILIPGMLAAGVGTLIFVGLDNWPGYGTFSLSIPNIPPFTTP